MGLEEEDDGPVVVPRRERRLRDKMEDEVGGSGSEEQGSTSLPGA